MKEISYVIWKEGKYYVSRCLNVEISSFGETIDAAIANLKEAVQLFFENETIEFLI
ncbi:MAG: type II toxin-antitoxin system HicB family antitoxin [Ignavibacteriaceae bacterium]